MSNNPIAKSFPALSVHEISDVYLQKNFRALQDYFSSQNQLLNFKFIEFVFTAAVQNQKIAHGCGALPQDVIITRVTGTGVPTLNWGSFDASNIDVTATGPCRIRVFVGTYWNQQTAQNSSTIDTQALSQAPSTTTIVQAAAAPSSSSTLSFLNSQNHLVNSAFDYWQAVNVGTPSSYTVINGASSYIADQWYVKNSLGTNGVLSPSQGTGVVDGSIFNFGLVITTAPTAAQANGCELYQVLSNKASIAFYNKTASLSIQIRAAGNVNQVGLQFFYAATEVKPTIAIGNEVAVSVGATYTLGSIVGQAIGTSQTTAGVIGVRIRILGVTSGNTWDLNNGFQVEQAMLNLGSVVAPFVRQYIDPAMEVMSCQYFYSKSYPLTIAPATATNSGLEQFRMFAAVAGASTPTMRYTIHYSTMRTAPAVSLFSNTGTAGKWSMGGGATDQTMSALVTSDRSSILEGAIAPATTDWFVSGHWVADARI